MLNVQKFIKEHGLSELHNQLAIKIKKYEEERLVVLNYNQIGSPKDHPVTKECRGLVLDLDTFEVVSQGFDRFFNLGECDTTIEDGEDHFAKEKMGASCLQYIGTHVSMSGRCVHVAQPMLNLRLRQELCSLTLLSKPLIAPRWSSGRI